MHHKRSKSDLGAVTGFELLLCLSSRSLTRPNASYWARYSTILGSRKFKLKSASSLSPSSSSSTTKRLKLVYTTWYKNDSTLSFKSMTPPRLLPKSQHVFKLAQICISMRTSSASGAISPVYIRIGELEAIWRRSRGLSRSSHGSSCWAWLI